VSNLEEHTELLKRHGPIAWLLTGRGQSAPRLRAASGSLTGVARKLGSRQEIEGGNSNIVGDLFPAESAGAPEDILGLGVQPKVGRGW